MAIINLSQGVIDVAEMGMGKPLVLFHSLLADRSIFDRVVPLLARDRRVIVPDLPGFGGSSSAGATIDGIADRLAELLVAMDLDPSVTDVLGNGFGGFIASTLAIRHGERFNRLLLVDTGIVFSDEGRQSFHVMAGRARSEGMAAIVDIAMKRLFPPAYLAENPEVLEQRRTGLLNTHPEFFALACEALATLDLSDQIGSIRNQTLVVYGELDAATPPAMCRALAQAIEGAALVSLPDLGHAPMAQDPGAFMAAVSDFLNLGLHQ